MHRGSRERLVVGLLIALFAASADMPSVRAQESSVRPDVNRSFQDPDVPQFVERFEREGREVYDKRLEIVRSCDIRPGMVVADIGAGTGLFTRLLAQEVGPQGRVYAVDIARNFVQHVIKSCRQEGFHQVRGLVCSAVSTDLPPRSIDLAFVCDTYHHFEYPQETLRSLLSALRPQGRLVMIDFERIEGVSSDWILNHVRAGKATVRDEILAAGFELVEEKELLEENYVLLFRKRREPPGAKVSAGRRSPQGIIRHEVASPLEGPATSLHVLLPDGGERGGPYRVVYVLPVEAGEGKRWGDALLEIQRHDLHNKHGLIFVYPTFAHLPWYADHPDQRNLRQESYFLRAVVPAIEKLYPVVRGPEGRLLLGFSKSGWGAYSLLLRHPDFFDRAAAWDAPLMLSAPNRHGAGSVFATQQNFDRYRIAHLLMLQQAALSGAPRLVLTGYDNFRDDHLELHKQLQQLGVPHLYRDGPRRRHAWDSGWVPEAVQLLLAGANDD